MLGHSLAEHGREFATAALAKTAVVAEYEAFAQRVRDRAPLAG